MPATIKPFLDIQTGTRARAPGSRLSQFGLPQGGLRDIMGDGGNGEDGGGRGLVGGISGFINRRLERLDGEGGNGERRGLDDIGGLRDIDRLGDGDDADGAESLFQIEIPEELRRQAEEGIGRAAGRAEFTLGGSEIAAQAGRTQRELRGQPFLQGASASGFAQQRVRQVTIQKNKALQRLAIGIESKSEQVRRRALDELKAIEFQNEQLKRDFENMRERERLQAEARRQRFLLAERQFRATRPKPWWEQAVGFGLEVGPSLATGGITGGITAGAGQIVGRERPPGAEGGGG